MESNLISCTGSPWPGHKQPSSICTNGRQCTKSTCLNYKRCHVSSSICLFAQFDIIMLVVVLIVGYSFASMKCLAYFFLDSNR